MQPTCVVCHDQVAAFRCIQCHKPVCDECAFKDDNGAFCSRECAANYRSFKRTEAGMSGRRRGGLLKTLLVLIVLAVIAALVAWKLGKLKLPWLEPPGVGTPAEETGQPVGESAD